MEKGRLVAAMHGLCKPSWPPTGRGKSLMPTQPLAKQQQKSKDFIALARVAHCVGDDTGSILMTIPDNEVGYGINEW